MADIKDFKHLVGMSLADAAININEHFSVRATEKNGKALIKTMDYRPERVNVAINEENNITRIKDFG